MEQKKPLYVIEATNALATTALIKYVETMHEAGVSPAVIKTVNEVILSITEWQNNNPEKVFHPSAQDEHNFQDLLDENNILKHQLKMSSEDFGILYNQLLKSEDENATLRGEKIFLQNTVKGFTDLMREILPSDAKEKLQAVLPELQFPTAENKNFES